MLSSFLSIHPCLVRHLREAVLGGETDPLLLELDLVEIDASSNLLASFSLDRSSSSRWTSLTVLRKSLRSVRIDMRCLERSPTWCTDNYDYDSEIEK